MVDSDEADAYDYLYGGEDYRQYVRLIRGAMADMERIGGDSGEGSASTLEPGVRDLFSDIVGGSRARRDSGEGAAAPGASTVDPRVRAFIGGAAVSADDEESRGSGQEVNDFELAEYLDRTQSAGAGPDILGSSANAGAEVSEGGRGGIGADFDYGDGGGNILGSNAPADDDFVFTGGIEAGADSGDLSIAEFIQ